ncbi:MAG TPA: class D sortase [Candidatus Polarisedimenticolaceae bacterium]|nr:class D sortase [Candidatus Polarisedimenticolaceae bacterium]
MAVTGMVREVRQVLLRSLERALLVLGVLALAVFAGAHLDRALSSRAALAEIEEPGSADVGAWSAPRIAAYREALGQPHRPPLGALRIPRVGLTVPVFDGIDELTLNRGVGRIPGTARPGEAGNLALAGHRDGFFRGLKDVAAGDVLELRTPEETRTYVVDRVVVVEPDDVSVLDDRGAPTLTLVTCYPFYFVGHAPQRWVVQASLKAAEGRPS